MSEALLAVDDLVAGYDPAVPIVRGASLAVAKGEILAVLGPNGAGKSTLIKAVAGLVPVTSGRVTLAGRDITAVPAHRMVRHGLGFVPQTENVFAGLSIADNLRLAAGILPAALRAGRIVAMLDLFPDLATRPSLLAGRLSGGQRQMLAIARALVVSPSLVLLDEPSAGLSPKLVGEVFGMLAAVRETGVTIVLVEQNARAALSLADRAVVLVEGRQRHEGAASTLLSDPEVAAAYLGGVRQATPVS
jgi:branched-chain amino acid transport system ATP-binding protein